MSRKFHITSIDIFDTLMAKGRRIGIHGLINMAKNKYILVSKDDDKEKLAEYISQLPYDYDDIVSLYEIIEQDTRREKLSTMQIKKKMEYNQFQEAIDNLSTQLANSGEKLTIKSNPNQPILFLEYEYPDIDFGKATMLQETIMRDRIEFSLNKPHATDVRFAANQKCQILIDKIIKEIEQFTSDKLQVDEIELSHIPDGGRRNQFFFSLISKIPGLDLDDVSGVKISKSNTSMSAEDDINDTQDEALEPDAIATKELTGFIKEVAIKGRAILSQTEYKDFVSKGFFISNIVWKSLDKTIEPNLLVEFEAGFANHQECKGFQYTVKGAYSFKKSESIYSTTRKPLSEPEKLKYKSKLEESARKSKKEASHEET
ncbi:hypothetical protein [Solidesulfovibrio carbinolicus]|uniref:hypothetical protein n=1 Tax=Solidesulfovibrio carbinolicus TaxID=296842 RepID=UPI00101343E0|nr:hypothetical protein [Solidesulfovibrio carbinolicus]